MIKTDHQSEADTLDLPGLPAIPGLRVRFFAGDVDYERMSAVQAAARTVDGQDSVDTATDLKREYESLSHFDPRSDVVLVEADGKTVGWASADWDVEESGRAVYFIFGTVVPEWRRRGIGRALIRYQQQRQRESAARHPHDGPRVLMGWALESQPGKAVLLRSEGFQPDVYIAKMTRPDLENIPDALLPEGLEVRPVEPEHHRAIWEAEEEAFRDHWGFIPGTEKTYQAFLSDRNFDPSLWRVAWDVGTDQVAGMVRSYIDREENAASGWLRGYTEHISVRRPWRRKGVARALIALSLEALKGRGMTEAALHVHTENPNGAYGLYESMGFAVAKTFTVYVKPLDGHQ